MYSLCGKPLTIAQCSSTMNAQKLGTAYATVHILYDNNYVFKCNWKKKRKPKPHLTENAFSGLKGITIDVHCTHMQTLCFGCVVG